MEAILINYSQALKFQNYMETEIKKIATRYYELANMYKETKQYNMDIQNGNKRSFYRNFNITDADYDERVTELRIRQYETYLEWKKFTEANKLPRYIYILRELIVFTPGYDNVETELERLKEKRGY